MAIYREGISFRIHKLARKTYRFANQLGVDIDSVEIVKDPADVTVTQSVVGQNIYLTISNVDANKTYEIGPKITFTNSEIDYFPINVKGWE